jgi:hypothetical protein
MLIYSMSVSLDADRGAAFGWTVPNEEWAPRCPFCR